MSSAPEGPLPLRPTVASIDLDAYRENIRTLRSRLPAGTGIIAVLKANGYGHGAVPLARACEEEGVDAIAVALVEEAIEIRRAGVGREILVIGPLTRPQLALAAAEGFVVGIVGPEELHELSEMAAAGEPLPRIHLELDSGMGRLGLVESDLREAAGELRRSSIRPEAIYTHFANASDPEDEYSPRQIENFERMLSVLRAFEIDAPRYHVANSAATLRGFLEGTHFVRVGLLLLGAGPLDHDSPRLRPVMRWTSEVARLKRVGAGTPVGYGLSFTTERPSLIATVPAGYADGYDRLLSNRGEVLVRGERVPVVGRVSMDLITIDVTDVPNVTPGDEVVLLGRQGDEEITAEEIARKCGTIAYEVFCRISDRVARVYASEGAASVASKFTSDDPGGSTE
jgi:alanine racemase